MSLENDLEVFNKEIQPEGWTMDVRLVGGTPVLDKGLQYLGTKQDILLALCLNNGYYNRENIYRMLKFSLAFSKRVQVFTTDGAAKHNYRAFGKSESDIVIKTRLARNRLRNQCMDALNRFNTNLSEAEQRTITFMDWETIYTDQSYKDSYAHLKKLYAEQAAFKSDIDSTSREVLLNRIGIEGDVDAVLGTGIEYVLEELAFILAYQTLKPEIKPAPDHGTTGFNYTYYEEWPVFENLINGVYDGKVQENIGFVIVKIDETATAT